MSYITMDRTYDKVRQNKFNYQCSEDPPTPPCSENSETNSIKLKSMTTQTDESRTNDYNNINNIHNKQNFFNTPYYNQFTGNVNYEMYNHFQNLRYPNTDTVFPCYGCNKALSTYVNLKQSLPVCPLPWMNGRNIMQNILPPTPLFLWVQFIHGIPMYNMSFPCNNQNVPNVFNDNPMTMAMNNIYESRSMNNFGDGLSSNSSSSMNLFYNQNKIVPHPVPYQKYTIPLVYKEPGAPKCDNCMRNNLTDRNLINTNHNTGCSKNDIVRNQYGNNINYQLVNKNISNMIPPCENNMMIHAPEKLQKHDDDINLLLKSNYFINKCNNANKTLLKYDKGDYTLPSQEELERNSVYKYADTRLHELSASLKDIKEDIIKLSTKVSELSVNDTVNEQDSTSSNKNVFKTNSSNNLKVEEQYSDSNKSSLCSSTTYLISRRPSTSSGQYPISRNLSETRQNKLSAKSIPELLNIKSDSQLKTQPQPDNQIKEINSSKKFDHILTSDNRIIIKSPNSLDRIDMTKRTTGYYTNQNTLNSKQNKNNDRYSYKLTKRFLQHNSSNDRTKLRETKSDKILTKTSLPESSQIFDIGNYENDNNINRNTRRQTYSREIDQYSNTTFNNDSSSDKDEDNTDVEVVSDDTDFNNKISAKTKVSHYNHRKEYFLTGMDNFRSNKETQNYTIKTDTNNLLLNEKYKIENSKIEKKLLNGDNLSQNDKISPKLDEQKPVVPTTPPPVKRGNQFGLLCNVKVLSKILEEDEERINVDSNMKN